jgi:hypothetical protein
VFLCNKNRANSVIRKEMPRPNFLALHAALRAIMLLLVFRLGVLQLRIARNIILIFLIWFGVPAVRAFSAYHKFLGDSATLRCPHAAATVYQMSSSRATPVSWSLGQIRTPLSRRCVTSRPSSGLPPVSPPGVHDAHVFTYSPQTLRRSPPQVRTIHTNWFYYPI